jgi:hypothetical protein
MMMCSLRRSWGGCDDYYEVGRSEVRTNDCLVDGGGGRRNKLVLIRDRAI